jgi:hypothetical protein
VRPSFARRTRSDPWRLTPQIARASELGTRCYMLDAEYIGFQNGQAWLKAEVAPVDGVTLDKFGLVPLSAEQCLLLARWLTSAAARLAARFTNERKSRRCPRSMEDTP